MLFLLFSLFALCAQQGRDQGRPFPVFAFFARRHDACPEQCCALVPPIHSVRSNGRVNLLPRCLPRLSSPKNGRHWEAKQDPSPSLRKDGGGRVPAKPKKWRSYKKRVQRNAAIMELSELPLTNMRKKQTTLYCKSRTYPNNYFYSGNKAPLSKLPCCHGPQRRDRRLRA